MATHAAVRVPTQARAQRTRAALLEAARAEFGARGWEGATARSIAERAGVATGSFYQYFADKDAALRELVAARLAGLGARVLDALEAPSPGGAVTEADVRRRMRAVVDAVTHLHRDDPGLHAVLTERRHADAALEAAVHAAEGAVVDRIAALLARWGHPGDSAALAFVLFGMVEGAVHAHVLGGARVSDARFVAALVEALVRLAMPTAPPARTAPARARAPRPRNAKERR